MNTKTDHGTCEDCGKPSRHPLARRRCRTCYPKHVQQLKQAGEFTPHWHRPLADRLQDYAAPGPGDCIHWTGTIQAGYGRMTVAGQTIGVHRVAYELRYGPIPAELVLDHLCHSRDPHCVGGRACLHRRCINPEHLEPVTQTENTRRGKSFSAQNAAKSGCSNGHAFTPENTSILKGQRVCLACKRDRGSASRERERGGAPVNRRRTHCKRGHEFTPENTYISPKSQNRSCRACQRPAPRIASA